MGLRRYALGRRVDDTNIDLMHDLRDIILRLYHSGATSRVMGGNTAGDKLEIQANHVDGLPKITLTGALGIHYNTHNTQKHEFAVGGTTLFEMIDAAIPTINTLANKDIRLAPNGTGKVRFGAYTVLGAEVSEGFITIKDEGGTARKLLVVA